MGHDLIAELNGYRNELASARRRGRGEHAAAIAAEVTRVTEQINTTIGQLLDQADGHDAGAQHILGAQARTEAGRLRRALEADQPPATETTQQKAPRERAVTKKAGA